MPCPYLLPERLGAGDGLPLEKFFWPTKLFQNLPSKFSGGFAPIDDDVLAVKADFFEFLRRGHVFGRRSIKAGEPFGVDVQTAAPLRERTAIEILALFAEQPVDVNLGGVGMRRIGDHGDGAEAVAAAHTFFDRGQYFNRQTALDVRIDKALCQTERDRKISFSQIHGDLLAVAMDEQILFGKPLEKLLAFGSHQIAPKTLTGARNARLEHADLAFPFWLQEIVVGIDFTGLDQIGIEKRRRRKIGGKRIDKTVSF